MTDLRSLSKEVIEEFIDLYKSFPCLWKIKSKEYSDRDEKKKAYTVLVDKLKESIPNCTKELVVKKIDSMRGNFRKEYKKVITSQKSGAGSENVYVPILWYYDKLFFLKDQEIPRRSINTINILDEANTTQDNSTFENLDDLDLDNSLNNTFEDEEDIYSQEPSSAPRSQSSSRVRKQKRVESLHDNVLRQVQKRLKEDPKEDENDIVGKNFACKIRALPKEVRTVAEKLMSDILFEAAMGNINVGTTMILSNTLTSNNHQDIQDYISSLNPQ